MRKRAWGVRQDASGWVSIYTLMNRGLEEGDLVFPPGLGDGNLTLTFVLYLMYDSTRETHGA